VDKAVISCKGLDMERGITDSNEMEAQIKKLMLASAGTRILAADSTKFDRISFTRIGGLQNLDYLITDKEPVEKWKQVFEKTGINLKYE
jgi:DeoR/GlpR family transcriptional regulator of sugar metabolism